MPSQNAGEPGCDDELPGTILLRVIAMLESAGIRTCILHGYQALPTNVPSDVDCVVSASIEDVVRLLQGNVESIGARIVRHRGSYVVLAARRSDGLPGFLCLDLMRDCTVEDFVLYTGNEVLAARRKFGQFWIPAAPMAFTAYLARSLYKRRLDEARMKVLDELYREKTTAIQVELGRFWQPETSRFLAEAFAAAEWDQVRAHTGTLRAQLIVSCLKRAPWAFLRGRWASAVRRMSGLFRPAGATVVLLGPDGAGKSSAIDALGCLLDPAFARHEVRGFAPALGRLLGRKPGSTAEPHGLPARSLTTSLLRVGYWLAFNLWSHLSLRVARARSTLVLYDRHFCDILIDPRRYRYGGPRFALRLNAWLMPRPDLVLMLDAPAEVVQGRKQEVPIDETERQLAAYRGFVGGLSNGHIIDASRSREQVAAQAAWTVLDWRAERQTRITLILVSVRAWLSGNAVRRAFGLTRTNRQAAR
jgi:thymidylate kinase